MKHLLNEDLFYYLEKLYNIDDIYDDIDNFEDGKYYDGKEYNQKYLL